MFAVIKTGGKQFRVAADDVIRVSKLSAKAGEIVTFPVLMLGGDNPVVGTPTVAGAAVAAEVVEERRGPKIIAFKKRRRKHSKRKRGYRDVFTVVRITEILTDGKAPSRPAKTKAVPKAEVRPAEPAAEPVEAAEAAGAAAKAAAPKPKAPAKRATKPAKGKKT